MNDSLINEIRNISRDEFPFVFDGEHISNFYTELGDFQIDAALIKDRCYAEEKHLKSCQELRRQWEQNI